jgi:hypothetical protein
MNSNLEPDRSGTAARTFVSSFGGGACFALRRRHARRDSGKQGCDDKPRLRRYKRRSKINQESWFVPPIIIPAMILLAVAVTRMLRAYS